MPPKAENVTPWEMGIRQPRNILGAQIQGREQEELRQPPEVLGWPLQEEAGQRDFELENLFELMERNIVQVPREGEERIFQMFMHFPRTDLIAETLAPLPNPEIPAQPNVVLDHQNNIVDAVE